MKKSFIFLALITSVFASCQNKSSNKAIVTHLDSISYIMGANDGQQLSQSFKQQKFDSLLNLDLYFKGIKDATSKEPKLDYEVKDKMSMVQEFFREYQMNQMEMAKDSTGTVKPMATKKEKTDSISYIMGANDGQGMVEGFKTAGLDTTISFELYLQGLFTTGNGKESLIPIKENIPMIQDFFQELQQKKLMKEFGHIKQQGEEFLAKNKAREEVTETESGLQYEIIKEGKGAKPTINDKVKVHYHGTLADGTVFDSSVERKEPIVFNVGGVISGWTEALQLMPVGSKWKLYIPYELAYGTRPQPGGKIKPFDMLIFEVELLEIVK